MGDDIGREPRLQALLEKIPSFIKPSNGSAQVQALAGDGSDRKFFRIRQGSTHFVALISPRREGNGIDENDSYFLIGKHLYRHELPVPYFFWADPGLGLFLLEDFGDYHLQRRANHDAVSIEALYHHVLRLLIRIHKRAPDGFEERFCFDTVVYDPGFVYSRELEYFRKAFLVNYLGMEISEEDLRRDFENLSEAAGTHERSLVIHRDFQSRNILIHRGSLGLLDFQGMRYGPPEYDLASLMLDPYVHLPLNVQRGLVELYWSGSQGSLNCSRREFHRRYSAVRLCRNMQVLGAYGFLGTVKGKRHFLNYVPRALKRLYEWLISQCRGRYPRLERSICDIMETGRIVKEIEWKSR